MSSSSSSVDIAPASVDIASPPVDMASSSADIENLNKEARVQRWTKACEEFDFHVRALPSISAYTLQHTSRKTADSLP